MSYTESQARIGLGTELKLGQGDGNPNSSPPVPETFHMVGEVVTLGKSGAKADELDATNMQSPNGLREYKSGLRTAGEISCTTNFVVDDTTQAEVQALFYSGAVRDWRIIAPPDAGEMSSPGYWQFKGFVNAYGDATLDPGKLIQVTFKVRITGSYDWVDTP